MRAPDSADAPQSLWQQTAGQAPAAPALAASLQCDVVIVGAGITGLSTALHLSELGLRVCVLDAQEPGWGASGRNGGQVIPGIKHDPKAILARYGKALGEPLLQMVASASDAVFELIERHAIACHAMRAGWIQPAHSPRALETVSDRAQQWLDRGAAVEMLNKDAVSARLGTDRFLGGWIDRRAGSIQPLSYTRGLVAAAQAAGASVHGHTRVTALERSGQQWLARTEQGVTVRAEHALIATNGYTNGLWPGLQRSVIAANSFIVATGPLDPKACGHIMPGGVVASDSRRLLLYFRRDHEDRFVLGGRGHFADPASEQDWDHLVRGARMLFPELARIPFTYRWAGRIALTRDFVPHVHQPSPNLHILLGYNGRGVALATQMGRYLARTIAAGEPMPYPVTPIRPLPFHGLKRFYIALGVAYYGLCDKLS